MSSEEIQLSDTIGGKEFLSPAQILNQLVEQLGSETVRELLSKVSPEPPILELPPYFAWDAAMDMRMKDGPEMATVVGLSLISEQLNFICQRLSHEED